MKLAQYILVLSYSLAHSQDLPQNLLRYYDLVNRAEMNIIDSNYNSAFVNYSNAFKVNSHPFGRDVFNAMICSAIIDSFPATYFYAKELLAKGFSIETLKHKIKLNKFINSKYGALLIKDCSKLTIDSNRKVFRSRLDSIEKEDQKLRIIGADYQHGKYRNAIRSIDSSNAIYLLNFIIKNGFPGEQLIGINDSNLCQHPYSIILLHQAKGSGNQGYDFYTYIETALKNGILDSRYATYMMDVSRGTDEFGNALSRLYYFAYDSVGTPDSPIAISLEKNKENLDWAYQPIDQSKETALNYRRKEVGLETIDEYRKKVGFWLKDQDKTFQFCIIGACSINTIMDRELYERIISHMLPIDKQ